MSIYSQLPKRFPHLFAGDDFLFECREGWFNLIESLCLVLNTHRCSDPIVVVQVKEKYGGLRFYFYGGDEFVQGAVQAAEMFSTQVCEECGSMGISIKSGWLKTRCEAHKDV